MDNLELFFAQNPWQEDRKFTVEDFIPRQVYNQTLEWLEEDEIVTITGPRQAGKTTILFKVVEDLLNRSVDPLSIIYINFDQEEYREEFSKPQQLFSFVKSRGEFDRYYLFLDEIQRLDETGLFLKVLYDLPGRPLKMFASGSSSLLLRVKTKEHLTGRQVSFDLLPLSFREIAGSQQFKLPSDASTFLLDLLHGVLVYGGYPRPFLTKDLALKQKQLVQLYKDYVRKDIRDFAQIEKVSGFNKLTRLLAYQIGNLINKEELSRSSSLDIRTVERYLTLLEQTFVVQLLLPFYTNRRKEIVKSPKVYFLDNGLRNAMLSSFERYEDRVDLGPLFENLVLTEIAKNKSSEMQLRFWRTQTGAEVDFVLVYGENPLPIEVKAHLSAPSVPSGLRSFIKTYQPPRAIVVSENFAKQVEYNKCFVEFLPFTKLDFDSLVPPSA